MLLAQFHETDTLYAMNDTLLSEELQQELGFLSFSAS